MASPKKQDGKKKTSITRLKKLLNPQKQSSKAGSSGSKLTKSLSISRSKKIAPKKPTDQNDLLLSAFPQSKKVGSINQTAQKGVHSPAISQYKESDMVNGTGKVSSKLSDKSKKVSSKQRGGYPLRSLDRGRVLRSKLDAETCKPAMNSVSTSVTLVTRKKKSVKKTLQKSGQQELLKFQKHIRYMLNRMGYEQSLIDAYSGEGWKGQSAEKIRPEKELERAKAEILRCKLKIREIFKNLDSLIAEGRLQESLFDPDGIDSENIFCGKCDSKETGVDNDIILCDGVCERGFHQKCLDPPLLSEDIPTGDEGWLCPHCDCKVECIDLFDEYQEMDLSIEDSWERIFPEAAALANGNGQFDSLNLPSDDSEDDDYDPDAKEVVEDEQKKVSSCGESDSISSSYDPSSSDDNVDNVTAELSTDDYDDDDYDPDAPDFHKKIDEIKTSSDESDFTSDSDEFFDELRNVSCVKETSASSPPSLINFVAIGKDDVKDDDIELPSSMLEINEKHEINLKSLQRRNCERLDYKKLYDEAYGKSSSDSSDDEEWDEPNLRKKLKRTDDKTLKVSIDSSVEKTPELPNGPLELYSSGCGSATVFKTSGANLMRLKETFHENRYPTREQKDVLAHELGMTFRQVTKWFDNARHSSRVSACELSQFEPHKEAKTSPRSIKKLDALFKENQFPSREKKEELAKELGITFNKVHRWFQNARRHSHISANEAPSSSIKDEPSCKTPNGRKSDLKADVKRAEAFTPDKAVITSTFSSFNATDGRDKAPAEGSRDGPAGRKKALTKELRKLKRSR